MVGTLGDVGLAGGRCRKRLRAAGMQHLGINEAEEGEKAPSTSQACVQSQLHAAARTCTATSVSAVRSCSPRSGAEHAAATHPAQPLQLLRAVQGPASRHACTNANPDAHTWAQLSCGAQQPRGVIRSSSVSIPTDHRRWGCRRTLPALGARASSPLLGPFPPSQSCWCCLEHP